MVFPSDLKYTKDHEWVKIEGDIATIGITDYAVSELGDVIFIEFPEIGQEFEIGDTLATIESTKAVSDIFSPVKGEVIEINTPLKDTPENIAEDPYGEFWLVKMRFTKESDEFLSAKEYEEYIKEES